MTRLSIRGLSLMVACAAVASSFTGIVAPSVQAQFSDSYNFLKNVRDRKGKEVEDALNEPGTVIVNTASYTENPTLSTPLAEFRTYGAIVNGNLTANAGIGGTGITFTGTGITVTGTTLLSAATKDVSLTGSNDFVGNVTVTAKDPGDNVAATGTAPRRR